MIENEFIKHYGDPDLDGSDNLFHPTDDDDQDLSDPYIRDQIEDFVKNAAPGQVAHVAWAYAQSIAANSSRPPVSPSRALLRRAIEVVAVNLASIHTKL